MIHEIIDAIVKPRLAALSTIGVLGGLVNTVTKEEQREGQPPVRLSYPVGCGVSGVDCWRDGKYLALTPDSSKASVAFAEVISHFIGNTESDRRFLASWRTRWYFWANLAKMGQTSCGIPFPLLEQWRNALAFEVGGSPYDGVLSQGRVLAAMTTDDPARVWGKWTFGAQQGLFMYPYAWCAIDVDISANYAPECIPTFEASSEIVCITV
jgi:hypothetical protein